MQKIASAGATVDNHFTEGNAALAVPATIVSAAFLNSVQDELVNVATATGATLGTPGSDAANQVLAAIQELIKRGGLISPINFTVPDNQSAAADVTGFPVWLTTQVLSISFLYRVLRRNDTTHYLETGRAYLNWDSETSTWVADRAGMGDDSGIAFSAVGTGNANEYKLQYTSTAMGGPNYSGNLRITDIKTIRV